MQDTELMKKCLIDADKIMSEATEEMAHQSCHATRREDMITQVAIALFNSRLRRIGER